MPDLALRPCGYPSCAGFASIRGRCKAHAAKAELARGKTTARGYGADWRKLRARKLREQPLCEIQTHCGQGINAAAPPAMANEVDHKIPIIERPDLRLTWSNLQSACKPCNAAKGGRYEHAR